MKRFVIFGGMLSLLLGAMGCSSAMYGSKGSYASDDLYGTHDKTEIARKQQAKAEAEKAEAEARQAEWEARLAQAKAQSAESEYQNYMASADYDTEYGRRLRGLEASDDYYTPSDAEEVHYTFTYASAYEPAYYDVVVVGNQVYVEPKYVSSMYGIWGATIYVDPWYYGWNTPWIYPYSPWAWGPYGYYNWYWSPWSLWYASWYSPWYNPWYNPWYWPGGYYPHYHPYPPHHPPFNGGHRPNYHPGGGGGRHPAHKPASTKGGAPVYNGGGRNQNVNRGGDGKGNSWNTGGYKPSERNDRRNNNGSGVTPSRGDNTNKSGYTGGSSSGRRGPTTGNPSGTTSRGGNFNQGSHGGGGFSGGGMRGGGFTGRSSRGR